MHTGKHKTTQRSRILVKQGCVKSSLPGLLRLGDCTKETACHQYYKISVLNLVRTAKFGRRHISSIGHQLTTEAIATLVSAFTISRGY